MKPEYEDILRRWIDCIFSGQHAAARELLSPNFGLHDGLCAEDFVKHEIDQFKERASRFGSSDRIIFRYHSKFSDGFIVFFMARADVAETFLFEDVFRFDSLGIVGNQNRVEAVSKLRFMEGQSQPMRSIALRARQLQIRNIAPLFPVTDIVFHKSDTHDQDDFFQVNVVCDDASRTILERFRFFTSEGNFNQSIRMRGLDHPCFCEMPFPNIKGKRLFIGAIDRYIWSVTVKLVSGAVLVYDNISDVPHEFNDAIHSVTITDALDNDWVSLGNI